MEGHERRYIIGLLCRSGREGHIEAVSMLTRHVTRMLEEAAESRDVVGIDCTLGLLSSVLQDVREAWEDMPQPLPIEKLDKPSRGA